LSFGRRATQLAHLRSGLQTEISIDRSLQHCVAARAITHSHRCTNKKPGGAGLQAESFSKPNYFASLAI
jgi:hypothetical protein